MPCAPRMSGCRSDCLHRRMVLDYRIARHADEMQAEEAAIGYATEYAEYVQEHPLINFKDWLIGHRTQHEEEVAS